MSRDKTVVIAGAGGIGRAVGLLLTEWGELDLDLVVADRDRDRAERGAEWIRRGATGGDPPVRAALMPMGGTAEELETVLSGADLLLDCLPGDQAPRAARLARQHGLHYANLTEHVAETREIQELAEGVAQGFILQSGLAPGFVDVLGHRLFRDFCRDHEVDRAESLRLRVGGLPVHAMPPHYYGLTWSPAGLATEYVRESVVVHEGVRTTRPSLTEIATVRLGDLILEETLTSGGAADLPDALAGKVKSLDYKSLRHPGHLSWVRRLIERLEATGCRDLRRELERVMSAEIPQVEDDQVIVYAAVEGRDRHGTRQRVEEFLRVRPRTVGRHRLRAIQVTTAAGLAESARLLLGGKHQGVTLQSQIDPDDYLSGVFIRKGFYGEA